MKSGKSLISPDLYVKSLVQVDFVKLYAQGYKLILLDIDNTLSKHGSALSGDYGKEQVARIKQAGLECIIISNANSKRAKTFADSLELFTVPSARKPSRKGIRTALARYPQVRASEIVLIGDQLLTDILAGNRADVFTILVDPISVKESGQVLFKRPIEMILKKIFHIHRNDYEK
ncbi:MAG: YqeG family HAD IIIA-type phosphatase [Saccharofermentanales bacterium]